MGVAIALWMIAIVCGSIGWTIRHDYRFSFAALILILTAMVFGMFALLQTLDVMAYRGAARLREWQSARTWSVVSVAQAVERLTAGKQFELVEQFGLVTMDLIPGDPEPMLFLSTPGGRVAHDIVTDFLRQSVATMPYLMPVRRGGQPWREAGMVTALLVAQGWAEKGAGPHAAKLILPLEDVARRLWVDLALPELED